MTSFVGWIGRKILLSNFHYSKKKDTLKKRFILGINRIDFVVYRDEVEKVMTMMRQNPDQLTFKSNTLGLRRKCDVADFECKRLSSR